MSIFTSLVVDTIPVPGDPGQTVTIRKLAPKHLKAAMTASQRAALLEFVELKRLGATEILTEIQALQADGAALAAARTADPLLLYDRTVLLQKGIIGWSYDRSHDDVEALEDLDDDASEAIARAILRLTKPSLFAAADAGATEPAAVTAATTAAEEAARKNG
jgi:hypothetical protein